MFLNRRICRCGSLLDKELSHFVCQGNPVRVGSGNVALGWFGFSDGHDGKFLNMSAVKRANLSQEMFGE